MSGSNGSRGGDPAAPLPDQFCVADLLIDLGQQRVQRAGTNIPLPKLSYELLLALARSAPRIVSIDDLMTQVWTGLVVNPETVSQRIKLLRDAFGDDPQAPRYIASLRGRGYRLLPPVIAVSPAPPVAAESPLLPSAHLAATPRAVDVADDASPARVPESVPRWRRGLLIVAVSGLVLAAVGAVLWRQFGLSEKYLAAKSKATQVTVVGLPPRTVAVLPFDDLSINRDSGQLALAVPEMVLQRLGTVKDLIVIARGSSFSFAGRPVDASEIGRQLAARYLVEGTLQRVDDRLRVTAQLVDAQSGLQLRSLLVDRRVGEIFEMQDEIAAQLADTLQVQLRSTDMHRVDRSRGTSLDVYLSYLDAQNLINRWTVKDLAQAVSDLERAVKLDPTFALGYSELARAKELFHFLSASNDQSDRGELLPLINKALQLDPNLGEAYAMRGSLQVDPTAAEVDFRRGIELAPNYGPGYQMYAEELGERGRNSEAMAMIDEAIAIDPIAPRNLYFKGRVFEYQGKFADAEQYFFKALATGPEYPPAITRIAELKWELGESAEGIKFIERALRAEPQAYWIRLLACAMYLDVDDRQAAGSVAGGVPSNYDTTPLLAAYDRNYTLGAAHTGPWMYPNVGFSEYAYWISVDTLAIQGGKVDQTIDSLRGQLSLHEGSTSVVVSPDKFNFGAAYVLAHLLIIKGDRAGAAPLLLALKTFAERPENGGVLLGMAQLLSGDRESAIKIFTEEFRKNHFHSWWLRQRDPLLAEIRNDPRYVAAFQIELDRVSKQRKLLEEMRDKGDVPRR